MLTEIYVGLGADDVGEAALTYTWSVSGTNSITFSPNGTVDANNTRQQSHNQDLQNQSDYR